MVSLKQLRAAVLRWPASIDVRWWIASILVPLLAALIGVEGFRTGVLSLFGVESEEMGTEEDRERTGRLNKLAEELSKPAP